MKVEASLISEEDEGSGEGIVEALKKVVEVSKEVLKWVAGLLEDEAEDREGGGKDISILPEAVENCDFQCGLTKPLAGEQYWRIPGPVTAEVLKRGRL